MTRTCDVSPVQYEGTIDGRTFYFRARWDSWTFTIAETLEDAVLPSTATGPTWCRSGKYGAPDEEVAGRTPFADAERLIRQCAIEYLAENQGR